MASGWWRKSFLFVTCLLSARFISQLQNIGGFFYFSRLLNYSYSWLWSLINKNILIVISAQRCFILALCFFQC